MFVDYTKLVKILEEKSLKIVRIYSNTSATHINVYLLISSKVNGFRFMTALPDGMNIQYPSDTSVAVVTRIEIEDLAIDATVDADPSSLTQPLNTMVYTKNVEQFLLTQYTRRTVNKNDARNMLARDLSRQLSRLGLAFGSNDIYSAMLLEQDVLTVPHHVYRIRAIDNQNIVGGTRARCLYILIGLEDILSKRFDISAVKHVQTEFVAIMLKNAADAFTITQKLQSQLNTSVLVLGNVNKAIQELVKVQSDQRVHSRLMHSLLCTEKITFENASHLHNIITNVQLLDDVLDHIDTEFK